MNITDLRRKYHLQVCEQIIRYKKSKSGIICPNLADISSPLSRDLTNGIVERLGCEIIERHLAGQTVGSRFEKITNDFISEAFSYLNHVRPGEWHHLASQTTISRFFQYEHLEYLDKIMHRDRELSTAFGGSYVVKPDIVIYRLPVDDTQINESGILTGASPEHASRTPLRLTNYDDIKPVLHGVVSCKWTTRNDRAQNARTEVLNLIRNRKGHLPHIVAVTAEPMPSRIAAFALGTGDLDCVYHFALNELIETVLDRGHEDSNELIEIMVEGRRLRDISDLPFDLAI
ncbi:MAG: restriction endonuclease [Chloroflexi bacterium]|nr:restriction endonuclease [Chloroflexota bacterium]